MSLKIIHTTAFTVTALMMSTSLMADDLITKVMPESVLSQISREINGESAKRNLDQITQFHRTRASDQFRQAADHIHQKLVEYGLNDVETRTYPADGETMFGTQKSRPAWNVEMAELWELKDGTKSRRLAHWESTPLSVAQDSDSANVIAEVIYVAGGNIRADYEGLDVKGKIILTELQPSAVSDIAVKELGAVGVLSYAPNQRSAWWKEDEDLVRWGHLASFRAYDTFGFMITLAEAKALKKRLNAGETITMHAQLKASRSKGNYSLVTAKIPGTDPKVGNEEITFTCHLDHPRPGANDNASGCVSILEAARTLQTLINDGRIAAPRRSIRFIFPAEIEGSLIYLNSHPEDVANMKAVIHMDMVGGGPATKSVFRISRGPMSAADVSGDIAWQVGHFVNKHSLAFASGDQTAFPLVSETGGKEPLLSQFEWLDMGSDHDVFAEGSFAIPVVYLHDWPDIYIHTNKDTPANIDPTKLKRAAFIGASTAYGLTQLGDGDKSALALLQRANQKQTEAVMASKLIDTDLVNNSVNLRHWRIVQNQISTSICGYVGDVRCPIPMTLDYREKGTVYKRNSAIKGSMNGFGYSYLADKMDPDLRSSLAIFKHPDSRALAYESLNLVDGIRDIDEIIGLLNLQFDDVNQNDVVAYFNALKTIDIILPE